jgi:hypothetical protein
MDMPEQAALLGLTERRTSAELLDAADVMHERSCEKEVGAEPWVELGRLAAERRNADRVLEQTAGVAVVPVGASGGQGAVRRADLVVAHERVHHQRETRMRDLRGEELEEPVELVGVSSERGYERRDVGVLCRLDRSHLHLQLAAEALDPTEHPHRIALAEPRIEEIHVAPYASLDTATSVR